LSRKHIAEIGAHCRTYGTVIRGSNVTASWSHVTSGKKTSILIWENNIKEKIHETLNPLHVRVQKTLIPYQTLNVPLLTQTRLKAVDFDAKQNGVESEDVG
jgi:hypothetical protein